MCQEHAHFRKICAKLANTRPVKLWDERNNATSLAWPAWDGAEEDEYDAVLEVSFFLSVFCFADTARKNSFYGRYLQKKRSPLQSNESRWWF